MDVVQGINGTIKAKRLQDTGFGFATNEMNLLAI